MSKPPTPEQCDEWCKAAGTSDGWLERFAALAAAWGYEQGTRDMRERCARVCENDTEASHVLAQAIRALDPAPEPEPRR